MDERHKADKKGKGEEEEEQHSCGMCYEQGHESGAGEIIQNNNLHTLHQPTFISHLSSEMWEIKT